MEEKKLQIVRTNPEGLVPVFSNDFVIVHQPDAFYFTFSVVEPPAILSKEQFEQASEAIGVSVAKIAMSPEQVKKLLAGLQQNVDAYISKFGEIEEIGPMRVEGKSA